MFLCIFKFKRFSVIAREHFVHEKQTFYIDGVVERDEHDE